LTLGKPFLFIYSSPWIEGFLIGICVQSKAPIAHGHLYDTCQSALAASYSSSVLEKLIHKGAFSTIFGAMSAITFDAVCSWTPGSSATQD
jgi:hypothetical protein